jgi:hypothetical protein
MQGGSPARLSQTPSRRDPEGAIPTPARRRCPSRASSGWMVTWPFTTVVGRQDSRAATTSGARRWPSVLGRESSWAAGTEGKPDERVH